MAPLEGLLQDDIVVDDGVTPLLVVRVERGREAIEPNRLKRCSLALAVTSAVLNDEAVQTACEGPRSAKPPTNAAWLASMVKMAAHAYVAMMPTA